MSNQPYTKSLRLLSLFGIVLASALLNGCDWTLMNPKGQVGMDEKDLIITATSLMLIVVIPVIIMTFLFAWKYRASNTEATYTPNWAHSNKIEVVVWTIPCIIIFALGIVTWKSSHDLDTSKPLVSPTNEKPMVIEAVALDWKWLFIYPEQGIATVNEIEFPVNVPVEFHVTSGSVMNSFFIPQLGSQIYAMAGMQNKVNLIANEAGSFEGLSANYSGAGFSDMKFTAIAGTHADFDAWVAKVKKSPQVLNADTYHTVKIPQDEEHLSVYPVTYFASVPATFFNDIITSEQNGTDLPKADFAKTDTASVTAMPADMPANMPGMAMNAPHQ